ncbi:class III signal peptide-containing protein [Candidatus Woesearchaeota archaeon]|nr:class III signal peptide-containing protein [Candidatus Woesearchaeota archaeon]
MILFKKRFGQGSTEFILIIAAVIVILTGIVILVQWKLGEAKKQGTDSNAQELANLIRAEIQMAADSSSTYSREFFIPETLNGEDYDIRFNNQTEIAIIVNGREFVIFLNHAVNGSLQKGRNLIQKDNLPDNPQITITPLN